MLQYKEGINICNYNIDERKRTTWSCYHPVMPSWDSTVEYNYIRCTHMCVQHTIATSQCQLREYCYLCEIVQLFYFFSVLQFLQRWNLNCQVTCENLFLWYILRLTSKRGEIPQRLAKPRDEFQTSDHISRCGERQLTYTTKQFINNLYT